MPPAPPPKLLDKRTRPEELSANTYNLRALIGGPSGAGKSIGAITFPGKKLVVDFDGRASTFVGHPDVEVITIKEPTAKNPEAWIGGAKRILTELQAYAYTCERDKTSFPWRGVIFDGITAMGRFALNFAVTLDNKTGLGGYAAKQHYLPQMMELLSYISGSLILPCHVIYTCHLDTYEDDLDLRSQRVAPKITGKLKTEIPGLFDECYYAFRKKGPEGTEYYWTTSGTEREEFFKSSLNTLGQFWKDPIRIIFEMRNGVPQLISGGFAELLNKRFSSEKAG